MTDEAMAFLFGWRVALSVLGVERADGRWEAVGPTLDEIAAGRLTLAEQERTPLADLMPDEVLAFAAEMRNVQVREQRALAARIVPELPR